MNIIKKLYNKLISKYPGCINCAYFDDKEYSFICKTCRDGRNLYMDKYFKTPIHIKNLKSQCYICSDLERLCDDQRKTCCYEKIMRDHHDNTLKEMYEEIWRLEK